MSSPPTSNPIANRIGKRIKPLNREGNGLKFKRTKNLKCFKDMRDRMLAGWPLDQLVRFVQVDSKEMNDITQEALYEQLREYRKTIPPSEFVSQGPPPDMIAQRMRPYHEKAIQAFSEGLNELQELEKLYLRQIERIDIDTKVEKEQKKLIPSMSQEIRIAKELLESSSKLKMDLGLRKRHLGVMETEARLIKDVGEKYGDVRVLEALKDSQSRQRLAGVVAAVERFMLTDGKDGKGSSILDEIATALPNTSATEVVTAENVAEEVVAELSDDLEVAEADLDAEELQEVVEDFDQPDEDEA